MCHLKLRIILPLTWCMTKGKARYRLYQLLYASQLVMYEITRRTNWRGELHGLELILFQG